MYYVYINTLNDYKAYFRSEDMDKILVDESGYNQYLEEINKLKRLIDSNASSGSEAYGNAVGDGWHDNFAFEESMRKDKMLSTKLNSLMNNKVNIEIVDKINRAADVINIGDKLRICVTYADEDVEEYDVLLTGNYFPDSLSDVTEITLNSPIGKAIYLKKVQDDIRVMINNNEVVIKVVKKY